MYDEPDNTSSRWSSAHQVSGKQWLILRLESTVVLKNIKIGKLKNKHPCSMKELRVYGGLTQEHMTELLHTNVKLDASPETFSLRHTNRSGHTFPCRFVKIVPLAAHGASFNISIWHIAFSGVKDEEAVARIMKSYDEHREETVMRHILRHLRQRRLLTPLQSILDRTAIDFEHPVVTKLHAAVVVEGDWTQAEAVMKSLSLENCFNDYLRLSPPRILWSYLGGPCESSPVGRAGHAMCIDSSKRTVYVHGGWDGTKCLDDFWSYDIDSEKWSNISVSTSQDKNGPVARSCHGMVFDSVNGTIYLLGRLDSEGAQSELDSTSTSGQAGHTNGEPAPNGSSHGMSDTTSPCSEFYRYHTRGVDAGTWQLLTFDTTTLGGPPLIFDTQMLIDEQSQIVYVIGGRLVDAADKPPRYSGIYSYDIRASKWKAHDLADNSRAPLRSGHCAAFDPWLRSIFVFGGQREDKHLGDMFTYDICTNTVSVMYTDGTQTHTKAFGRKSVIDFDLKEIYSFGGLQQGSTEDEMQVLETCSIYRYDTRPGVWLPSTPYRPPVVDNRRRDVEEPAARFAHELVYDSGTKTAYLLGGNPGQSFVAPPREPNDDSAQDSVRLGDFWNMRIVRLTKDDVLRQATFHIRCQQFRELCLTGQSSVKTLEFLQTNVSTVVNHEDPAEEKLFRSLLMHLLDISDGQEEAPAANDTVKPASPERWTSSLDDVIARHHQDPRETADPLEPAGQATSAHLFAQRNQLFESLLKFLDETVQQPGGSLLDLVDTSSSGL